MNEKMLIPISLMIAGLLIGSGVYFASANKPETQALDTKSQTEQKPVIVNTETDHILGSELAKVFVIEYSDLECPFCKKYHDGALKKLIKKYADNENVAFVFRHMPLASKHPSSFGQAIATECAGKIGGEKKFWEYKSAIFAETKSDGNFNPARLPQIATELEINMTDFEICLEDSSISDKITASFEEGISAGVRGTPAVFIQLADKKIYPIPADFNTIDEPLSTYLNQLNK